MGYTGFVGSNILEKGDFDGCFNTKNIQDAYGSKPELLIYSGLRAEKFLANNDPEQDMKLIYEAEENIRKIAPKKLVLISTVDVFRNPQGVDENSEIETEGLHPYGFNRYQLELWARENFADSLIVRLPGLFGKNIKKNFIYDMIHIIPSMLKREKMDELLMKDSDLMDFYSPQGNGFFKVESLDMKQRELLKEKFMNLGFSALNFTDSRSRYQFYNLSHLWDDILVALEHDVHLWHPATEPIEAGELYAYVTGKSFSNEIVCSPARYDYRTIHSSLFGGKDGYISDKKRIMDEIRKFIGSL